MAVYPPFPRLDKNGSATAEEKDEGSDSRGEAANSANFIDDDKLVSAIATAHGACVSCWDPMSGDLLRMLEVKFIG